MKRLILLPFLLASSFQQELITKHPEYIIPHPYRRLQISNSNSNGFTTDSEGYAINDSLIYLGTVFDGHIYQYNIKSQKLSSRFRTHRYNRNGNSAGSLFYNEDNGILYAGTSSSEKYPEIYLFNTDNNDSLPFRVINVDPESTERIKVFFSPVIYRDPAEDYIFWGCYHYEMNGPAKVIKYNSVSETYQIIKFLEAPPANYTYSLAIIDHVLFISTENGYIIKYDLKHDSYLGSIDLMMFGADVKRIQHLASDGSNLWAMTNVSNQPLFLIKNPTSNQFRVIQVPNYDNARIRLSRIYIGPNNSLYGQGFKVSVNDENLKITPQPYLGYSSIGAMIGGYKLSSNEHFIIGDNFRIKDNLHKRDKINLIIAHLNKEKVCQNNQVTDPRTKNIGAILHTLGTDNKDMIYVSTFWIGFVYKLSSQYFYTEDSLKYIIGNNGNRINAQVDIIKPYGHTGDMLFGKYMGSRGSAYLMFYDNSENLWIEKQLPEPGGIHYPRITAIAVDANNGVFVGSGETTFNANTANAVIYKASSDELREPVSFNPGQQIDFSHCWPDSIPFPKRIMSMVYYNNSLYCVSLSRVKTGAFTNRFFRIDLRKNRIEMSRKTASVPFLSDKILFKDNANLILGFGNALYKYDLDRFDINKPIDSIDLGAVGSLRAIVGDRSSYYACFEGKIYRYDKKFEPKLIIDMPPLSYKDKFQTIDVLNGYLYAITMNGFLYRWDVHDLDQYEKLIDDSMLEKNHNPRSNALEF